MPFLGALDVRFLIEASADTGLQPAETADISDCQTARCRLSFERLFGNGFRC